jgi:hypothetical protein
VHADAVVYFDELGKQERLFQAKILITYIDMAPFSDYILRITNERF